jgi:hypothetical protein
VIYREIGNQWGIAGILNNLAFVLLAQEALSSAETQFREALTLNRKLGILPHMLESVIGLARLQLRAHARVFGAELAGLVDHHPAMTADLRGARLRILMRELEEALPADELEAAMQRGAQMDLDAVVKQLLEE